MRALFGVPGISPDKAEAMVSRASGHPAAPCSQRRHDSVMTDLAHLPNELTDAELAAAIPFWRKNRGVVSGDAILAMHVEEQRRRRAGSAGTADTPEPAGSSTSERRLR